MPRREEIDRQIKSLQTKKHNITIKENVKEHCYDTLFFTYEANYKKKVHFAYLADRHTDFSGRNSYAVLCKEGKWLSAFHDDGHYLDIVKLLDGEAIFMNWDEAVRDMCSECQEYLPLSQVVLDNAKVLRLKGDKVLAAATVTKGKLNKQANRLEGVASNAN